MTDRTDGAPLPPDAGPPVPTQRQLRYLRRGLDQAGGKLPLFDRNGQHVGEPLVRACVDAGWAEPWFDNPLKPDWLVCRLTDLGRRVATANLGGSAPDASPQDHGSEA